MSISVMVSSLDPCRSLLASLPMLRATIAVVETSGLLFAALKVGLKAALKFWRRGMFDHQMKTFPLVLVGIVVAPVFVESLACVAALALGNF